MIHFNELASSLSGDLLNKNVAEDPARDEVIVINIITILPH